MMVPERNRGLLWCSKARAPVNATDNDGYQTGCIWLNTDGAAGTCVYVNEGSVTVASWVAADTSAGDAAGTIEFDDATTGPLISIETTDQEGDAYLNPFLITGTYGACKKGIMLSASNPRPVTFLFDNHSVALGAADYRAVLSRVYICTDQANALTLNAMRAQIKLADGVDISNAGSVTAPFTGYFELAGTGARNLDGHVACVRAALEEGASGTTTVDINLCGFEATLNSSRTYAGSGYLAAFAANISGGTSKWQYGLHIAADAVSAAGIAIAATGATLDSIVISGAANTRGIYITGGCMDTIKVERSGTTGTTRRFIFCKQDLTTRHAEAGDDNFWGAYFHQTHSIAAATAHFIGVYAYLHNETGDAFQAVPFVGEVQCTAGVNRLACAHLLSIVTSATSDSGAAWGDTGLRHLGLLVEQGVSNTVEGDAAIAIDNDWDAGIWMDPSELTHVFKFQAAAGSVVAKVAEVAGTDTSHYLLIDIAGVDHYIPVYSGEWNG